MTDRMAEAAACVEPGRSRGVVRQCGVRTLTPFFGRGDELVALDELLSSSRLVSVVGPGGIGKTRLAHEVARLKQAEFEGNVLTAGLAGVTEHDDVFEVVARECGLPSVDALRFGSLDQPRLVLLDNCEQVLAGAAAVARALLAASEATTVLVTSRVPLAVPGERVVRLGPLAVPATEDVDAARSSPAVQLFVDRAQHAGALGPVDDDLAVEIGRLVHELDGMPLAIELAASRSRVLSPAQIRARLDAQLGLLRRGGRDDDDPHRSMRAVIAGSYEPLPPDTRARFRALCVIGGPFDLELAHALVGGDDELGTVDLLEDLVDASLLVPIVDEGEGYRYRILEPIRLFGRAELEERGEAEAAADAFVDAMVAYADAFVAAVLEEFSAEVFAGVNDRFVLLLRALDRCIASDATAARANLLFLPLFGAARSRGEVIAVARRMRDRWSEPAPLHFEARAVMASAAVFGGDDELGRELAEEVLSVADAGPLPRLLSHRALGYLAAYADEPGVARHHLSCALADAADLSPAFAREIECSRCATAVTDEEVAASLDRLADVAERSTAAGELLTAQWALMIAAELRVRQGDLDAAFDAAARAMEVARDAIYRWSLGAAHRTLAMVHGLRDGWEPAAPHLRIALDHCLTDGDLGGAATVTRAAAGLALRVGDRSVAEALWATFPTRLGRSIIRSMLRDEEETLRATCGEVGDVDLARSMRRARALLGPSVEPHGAELQGAAQRPDDAAPSTTEPTVLRFGDCELDLALFELRRGGQPVHVEPQVFDVLAHLARRRGAVVTKEELLDEIWGDRFVSESALTSRIKAARQAIGDDGEAQRVIRTVRGRGYTLVAEVR